MITKMAYCILTVSLVIQSFVFTEDYKKRLVKEVTSVMSHIFVALSAAISFGKLP